MRSLLPENRSIPLMEFGLFSAPPKKQVAAEHLYSANRPTFELKPGWSFEQYRKRFNRHLDYMRAGDVYQINLTFPMFGYYDGDIGELYAMLRHRQAGRYGGIIALGETEIMSLSPELFYKLDGCNISMKPMKGTRKRLLGARADKAMGESMLKDEKSMAENLMIVDLLRNDISRIAETGSVQVPELFTLETYDTLHQMTSRIEARIKNDTVFKDIINSLFPCGSVTGAPKIRAMEIIRELEDEPRGAYCGAIGYIDPPGNNGSHKHCFNVAIRSLTLNKTAVTYSVGSGVVLDSVAEDEYAECLLKADIIKPQEERFIETFRWEPDSGFIRIEAHLARLMQSVPKLDKDITLKALTDAIRRKRKAQCIRLTANKNGDIDVTAKRLANLKTPVKIMLSRFALTPSLQTIGAKTNRRQFYDGERRRIGYLSGADEVVFVNSKNEICEGSFTSIFMQCGDQILTPDLSCGLLPGILRAELIKTGKVKEALITLDDMQRARAIYVGNSLRGLMEARFLQDIPI